VDGGFKPLRPVVVKEEIPTQPQTTQNLIGCLEISFFSHHKLADLPFFELGDPQFIVKSRLLLLVKHHLFWVLKLNTSPVFEEKPN
jgi:hypothetical protein